MSHRWGGPRPRHRGRVQFRPAVADLESRIALSAPAVVMLAATTADSQGVTVDYQVNRPPDAAQPLSFGVYRSADDRFDPGDSWVGTLAVVPPAGGGMPGGATLDLGGDPAADEGSHRLTIPLAGGLPPYPEKPYVLVVANPGDPSAAADPRQTASFRKYVIGVVTHGGIQDKHWKHGPPWQLQIATLMRREGYDAVIPYNWVSESSTPGRAAVQGPRLASRILADLSRFPASAPIDLHFIGHSEGAVVNTVAIVALGRQMPPQLEAGFIEDTLLDPHAANSAVTVPRVSTSGLLGGLARAVIDSYETEAKDPPVFIPPEVDDAQVFYQHTPAEHDHGVEGGIYNLWGQVPVRNPSGKPIAYYNLTAAGATHSGNTGVALWYRNFVAPTLGDQAAWVRALRLDGRVDAAVGGTAPAPAGADPTSGADRVRKRREERRLRVDGPAAVVATPRASFSGTAAPGAAVRLYVGPASVPWELSPAGRAVAGADGHWSASVGPLHHGQYRAVVTAFDPASRIRPGLTVVSTAPLGRFVMTAQASPPGRLPSPAGPGEVRGPGRPARRS